MVFTPIWAESSASINIECTYNAPLPHNWQEIENNTSKWGVSCFPREWAEDEEDFKKQSKKHCHLSSSCIFTNKGMWGAGHTVLGERPLFVEYNGKIRQVTNIVSKFKMARVDTAFSPDFKGSLSEGPEPKIGDRLFLYSKKYGWRVGKYDGRIPCSKKYYQIAKTNLDIRPGDSGAGVYNNKGEVIGLAVGSMGTICLIKS